MSRTLAWKRYNWRVICLSLLYAAFLLIKESRFALAAVNDEMDFFWKRGKSLGPEDLVNQGMKRIRWFGGVR